MARKPSFLLNGKCAFIVTSHSTYRVYLSPVSLWLFCVRSFGFGFVFLKLKLDYRSSERVLEKKERIQSTAVQESRASWTPSISQSSPRNQVQPEPRHQVQPEKTKRLLAQTSPALEPLPLAFCQLPIVSDLIICPKDDGGVDIALSLNVSTCFVLSLGRHRRAKRKHQSQGTCFREVSSLPRFQTTGNGSRKSPQALLTATSMKANFFLVSKCSMHHAVLLATRKFDQSAWRMAYNKLFLCSLDRGKLWEKSKGLALPRLEQQGTRQWSLNDIPKQKKSESSNEKHTHRSRFSPTMPRTSFPGHNCASGLFCAVCVCVRSGSWPDSTFFFCKTKEKLREVRGRATEREGEREKESLCSEHGMHKVRVAEEPLWGSLPYEGDAEFAEYFSDAVRILTSSADL